MELMSNLNYKQLIEKFIRRIDLGIEEFRIEQISVPEREIPDIVKSNAPKGSVFGPAEKVSILTKHLKYHDGIPTGEVYFNFEDNESRGTVTAFGLAWPILDSLDKGKLLIIDEFDNSLHFFIIKTIIELFYSKATNPKNAQFIFTTHDTRLLSKDYFRRDQIWFTEKDKYGETKLYSLAEFKVRNDASFEKDYMLGKYGAIPFIIDPIFGVSQNE
jgi:AAA15 family ATPase/GTPase